MVKGQMRCKDKPYVHVQIKGHEGNRDYGFATTFEVADIIWEILNQIEDCPLPSLAGTDKYYFPIDLEAIDDKTVRIHTPKGKFEIEHPELAEYIKEEEKNPIEEEILIEQENYIEIPVNQKGIKKIVVYVE